MSYRIYHSEYTDEEMTVVADEYPFESLYDAAEYVLRYCNNEFPWAIKEGDDVVAFVYGGAVYTLWGTDRRDLPVSPPTPPSTHEIEWLQCLTESTDGDPGTFAEEVARFAAMPADHPSVSLEAFATPIGWDRHGLDQCLRTHWDSVLNRWVDWYPD